MNLKKYCEKVASFQNIETSKYVIYMNLNYTQYQIIFVYMYSNRVGLKSNLLY